MIKLSECGYPKRRLWITLKSMLESLSTLISEVAHHQVILAPCESCKRHEAFRRTMEFSGKTLRYHCTVCSDPIEVENDLDVFGEPLITRK